jgi:hypothetical protein
MNWVNIEIDDFYTQYNKDNRPIKQWCNWCNAPAIKIVTRTSTFSGNTYTDYCCEKCSNEWQEYSNKNKDN